MSKRDDALKVAIAESVRESELVEKWLLLYSDKVSLDDYLKSKGVSDG